MKQVVFSLDSGCLKGSLFPNNVCNIVFVRVGCHDSSHFYFMLLVLLGIKGIKFLELILNSRILIYSRVLSSELSKNPPQDYNSVQGRQMLCRIMQPPGDLPF